MAGIFMTAYDSPRSSIALIVSFVAYFAVTIAITRYRNNLRASVNKSDNNANQVTPPEVWGCGVLQPHHRLPRHPEHDRRSRWTH